MCKYIHLYALYSNTVVTKYVLPHPMYRISEAKLKVMTVMTFLGPFWVLPRIYPTITTWTIANTTEDGTAKNFGRCFIEG